MFRRLAASALLLAAFAAGSPALAGPYTDDMAKCLVKATTPADQKALILWVFSAMASHPDVQPYANISQAQAADLTRHAAVLMERLVTSDCRVQTVAALKYEGDQAMEQSFQTLGEVAMRSLMGDPHVGASLSALLSYIDKSKWNALDKDAGPRPGR